MLYKGKITINGRLFKNSRGVINDFIPQTKFEKDSVVFYNDWFSGINEFSIKTSGSTGVPKIINISKDRMVLSAMLTSEALELSKLKKALICLNTNLIAGKMMMVRAFLNQMDMILVEPSSKPLYDLNESIDFIAAVPLQIKETLKNDTGLLKLNTIQKIIIGGAPIPYGLLKAIKKIKTDVYETYGMTETISHIALKKLTNRPSNYFQVLSGIHITTDKRGCLIINGEITGNKPLVTNDIVEIKDQSSFTWKGRADNIINSGGIKLQLETIENKIEKILHSAKIENRFLLAGLPDDTLGTKLVLLVESKHLTNEAILTLLKNNLAKYEVPKNIYCIANFKETASQKIDRAKTLAHIH